MLFSSELRRAQACPCVARALPDLKRFFESGDNGRKGQWAVDIDRNWRITFTFDGRDCDNMNYEDYH